MSPLKRELLTVVIIIVVVTGMMLLSPEFAIKPGFFSK